MLFFWTFYSPKKILITCITIMAAYLKFSFSFIVMDEQAGSAGNSPQHGRGSARQDVLRCGWLRKQGGFVKTWHTRWFVLRGDQLYYYKDEDETKALVSGCWFEISSFTHSFFKTDSWRLYMQTYADVHIMLFKVTRNYHDILPVQFSCQDANKRGEDRVTCFLPHWMMTCHGSSSNNGDFYPRGHAAGLE